jgi:DNA-binding NtrC family response regulator
MNNKKERAKVLIVDDTSANLKLLRDSLEPEDYEIMVATNGKMALRIATANLPDIILLDIVMPDMNGYEVCRRLKENKATTNIPVIFVTVRDEKNSIIEGLSVGGVDYITKPFEKEEVLLRVKNHLEINRLTKMLLQKNEDLEERTEDLTRANQQLRQEIARREKAEVAQEQAEDALQKADEQLSFISEQEVARWGIDDFVGKSQTIEKILDDVRKLQNAETTSVLITGESGTGKELIARAIHFGSLRSKRPFIPVNCSAIPGELAESSLFGHVRGAFTGANKSHKGYFELANGGTLFLDEIGDMPLQLQPKLLRVLEDGGVVPVGDTREKLVDVRVLAATNQNLKSKIVERMFREDLYFRLARFPVTVPPLRERQEDIPLLAEHFLKIFAEEMCQKQPVLTSEALSALKSYRFPGNVRELKNIIENALIRSNGSAIKPEYLSFIEEDFSPTHSGGNSLSSPSFVNGGISSETKARERDIKGLTDHEKLEDLVIKRALPRNAEDSILEPESGTHSETNEKRILAYVRENGSINNEECRSLLSSDYNHSSYLLKKMHRYGLLKREGQRRWARYYLP